MGNASFGDRRAHIGADAAFNPEGRSVVGVLGLGFRTGPFALVSYGTTHDDDFDADTPVFSATAGVGIPLGPTARTHLCPFFSAVILNGREFAPGQRQSSQAFGLGASVGHTLNPDEAMEVVPFVALALVTQTVTSYGTMSGTVATTDSHHALQFGAGFVLEKIITVRPFTSLTFAEGDMTSSYGLHVSLGFVRPTRPPPVGGEGSQTSVWVNTRTGVYYCPASPSYGATPEGSFMTEREAVASGVTPASGRRC